MRTVRTSGLLAALLAAVAMLLVSLLPSAVADPSTAGAPAALTAVAVLVALAVVARRPALAPLVARYRPSGTGAGDEVEAPSAYWCAVPVPRRPSRPRAPGLG